LVRLPGIDNCAVDNKRRHSKTVLVSDPNKIETAGESAPLLESTPGRPAATPDASAPAATVAASAETSSAVGVTPKAGPTDAVAQPGLDAPIAKPVPAALAAQPGLDALAPKPTVDEAKEKVLAAKASREMWTAILIIVGSFVFVLVAAALVIVIGHIQLF
jgi:hypothetical protein